jgi:hypothetical protein
LYANPAEKKAVIWMAVNRAGGKGRTMSYLSGLHGLPGINLLAFLVLMQPTYAPPLAAVCATQ